MWLCSLHSWHFFYFGELNNRQRRNIWYQNEDLSLRHTVGQVLSIDKCISFVNIQRSLSHIFNKSFQELTDWIFLHFSRHSATGQLNVTDLKFSSCSVILLRKKRDFAVVVFSMRLEQEENKKAHLKIHHNSWEKNLVEQQKHFNNRKFPYI